MEQQTVPNITKTFLQTIAEEKNIISDTDVNQILQDIIDAGEELVKENTYEKNWTALQTAAQNYIKANQGIKNIVSCIEKKIGIFAGEAAIQELAQLQYWTTLNYALAFTFKERYNAYLEEMPTELLYVLEDSTGSIGTYQINLADFIPLIRDITGTSLRGAKLKNKIKEGTQSTIEEQLKTYQKRIQQTQSAYTGVNNRLNVFYSYRKKEPGKNQWAKQKQGGLLLWKKDNKWIKARIQNLGDVKEGYVAALLDQHVKNISKSAAGKSPYYSHELIDWFFTNYISKVSNQAAIDQEDVISKLLSGGKRKTEYIVKSGDSIDLPGLSQYNQLACLIEGFSSPLNPKSLRKKISNALAKEGFRNKILDDTAVKEVLEKFDMDEAQLFEMQNTISPNSEINMELTI